MTELPTRKEMDEKLAHKAGKTNVLQKNVDRLDGKMDMILEGMDAQTQQLDIIRTDMKAGGGRLDLHERVWEIWSSELLAAACATRMKNMSNCPGTDTDFFCLTTLKSITIISLATKGHMALHWI